MSVCVYVCVKNTSTYTPPPVYSILPFSVKYIIETEYSRIVVLHAAVTCLYSGY